MKSRGQATLLEVEDEPDVTVEELAGTPGRLEDLRKAFLQSRFGDMVPLFAERPFLLPLEGIAIKGRIDAIYGAAGRTVGGRRLEDRAGCRRTTTRSRGSQLDLYALACIEVWRKAPGGPDAHVLLPARPARSVRTRWTTSKASANGSGSWLRGIGAAAFEPTPGPQCRFCDFRPFCDAGKAWVAVQPVGQDEASRSICSSNDRYDAAGSQPPTICGATKRTCRPSGSARADQGRPEPGGRSGFQQHVAAASPVAGATGRRPRRVSAAGACRDPRSTGRAPRGSGARPTTSRRRRRTRGRRDGTARRATLSRWRGVRAVGAARRRA